MKKLIRSQCFIIITLCFVLAFSTQALGKSKKPILPDISDTWTEINPADVYPGFEYNGLTPSCASCPPTVNPDTGQPEFYDPEFTFFVKGGTTNKLVIYFQGGELVGTR